MANDLRKMRNKIFKRRKDVTNQQTIEKTYSQNCNLNPVTKNEKRKEEIQATTTKLMVLNQFETFCIFLEVTETKAEGR